MTYVLQAEYFDSEKGKFIYKGCMKSIFRRLIYAENYYDLYNSHLRPINLYKTLTSAYDKETNLRWRIVKYSKQELDICPFGINDSD